MPEQPPDFICQDCGQEVVTFLRRPIPDPPRCAICQWLIDTAPTTTPAEREELRTLLLGKRH